MPAPAEVVWARATSTAGIRHEMRPLLAMTMPEGLRGHTIVSAGDLVGRPLGRAWLFLFCVVPVDYDDMTLTEVGTRHFQERSRMLLLDTWGHRREVRAVDDQTSEVLDRLDMTVRLDVAPLRYLARRLVGVLFTHRQRRLASWARNRDEQSAPR